MSSMAGFLYPSVLMVMIAFGTMKVIEYSIMTAATEMIYMPMDSDVRYLGKELVKFFGHKLGKSASSIFLSIVSSQLRPSLSVQTGLTFFVTGFWSISMYMLSEHLKGRKIDPDSSTDTEEEGEDELDEKLFAGDGGGQVEITGGEHVPVADSSRRLLNSGRKSTSSDFKRSDSLDSVDIISPKSHTTSESKSVRAKTMNRQNEFDTTFSFLNILFFAFLIFTILPSLFEATSIFC